MPQIDKSVRMKGKIYRDYDSEKWMLLEEKTGEHIDIEGYLCDFSDIESVNITIKEKKVTTK